MNIRKIYTITLLAALAASLLMTATASAALPGILPTNHYMARNVTLIPGESSNADGTLPGVVVRPGTAVTFKTFDQFTCFAGDHELVMRIVKHDDGLVVASTKPINFKAPHEGYVHTQPTVWQLVFPAIGWYRHEIIVNKVPIAYYHFIVSFAL